MRVLTLVNLSKNTFVKKVLNIKLNNKEKPFDRLRVTNGKAIVMLVEAFLLLNCLCINQPIYKLRLSLKK